ncbi:NAC domain-containing protein 83-like isoform X2 [Durio zibethinus]|uniref:NAC domain-containing protein 83-like isoform X2 n=1 Tax=Durio zibethinus TaxID=66656 RepID=A0A6P6BIX2_DURZI|nr:NAC domain-containing protein 83-like isoform X2 [Durio zibethinus]
MEKLNFVKNGLLRLPPGFRFHPTDEELVVQYLRRKVLAWPLPASIIPEFDVCKADPWELPGDLEQERSNQVVGMKKTLVFYRGKPPQGSRTDWVMHEYRLVSAEASACNAPHKKNQSQSHVAPMENWVLCRIFLKKRSSTTKNDDDSKQPCNGNGVRKLRTCRPVFYDFLTSKDMTDLNLAPSSSSSGSSGITQVSNNDTDDHEESVGCSSFPYFRREP